MNAICTLLLTVTGCGASLPSPPLVKHPDAAFEEVPYPPPAVLAETVTKPSRGGNVWVEGSWRFRAKIYAWKRGGWFVLPQKNARYARPQVRYLLDGRIMFAPGLWYDTQGRPIEHVHPVTPAATPKNEYTSETETAR